MRIIFEDDWINHDKLKVEAHKLEYYVSSSFEMS